MKILVAIDDSPFSERAVDFVKRMAWNDATEVTVLSVARSPLILSTEIYASALSYDDDLMKQEAERHQATADRAASQIRETHPRTTSQILFGDPRIEIVAAASKMKADLVVVGSHGRSGLAKLVMGSVASYVATHAPCSVMIVKTMEH